MLHWEPIVTSKCLLEEIDNREWRYKGRVQNGESERVSESE